MSKNYQAALQQIKQWKQERQSIVLVTGVFDILHIEHLRFLKKAKQAGDKLVVAIESDNRVKQIKGEHRPINQQEIRLEQLSILKPVDLAFVLPEKFTQQEDWENFMQSIQPQIYAVSSHTDWLDNKRQLTEKYGGQLKIVHKFNPNISSSSIEEKLIQEI